MSEWDSLGVEGKLGDQICRFFSFVTDLPRSSRCLYKPEDLVRKGHVLITIVIQVRILGFRYYDLVVDQLL